MLRSGVASRAGIQRASRKFRVPRGEGGRFAEFQYSSIPVFQKADTQKSSVSVSDVPIRDSHALANFSRSEWFVRLHLLVMKRVYLMGDCSLHRGFPLLQSG